MFNSEVEESLADEPHPEAIVKTNVKTLGFSLKIVENIVIAGYSCHLNLIISEDIEGDVETDVRVDCDRRRTQLNTGVEVERADLDHETALLFGEGVTIGVAFHLGTPIGKAEVHAL